MNPGEKRVLQHLVKAFFGHDPWILERISLDRVIFKICRYVAEFPTLHRFVFRLGLFLVQWGVPPLAWKLRPFTRLSPEAQLHLLQNSWQHSLFPAKRTLFLLLKVGCVCNALTEHALLEGIGYGPALDARLGPPGPSTEREVNP
jgi:hypothetical protein